MKQTIYMNANDIIPKKEQVTVNARSGRQERIFVNLEAVYPTPENMGTELSFEELRAVNRGWLNKQWIPEESPKPRILHALEQTSSPATQIEVYREASEHVNKPAKLEVFREHVESPPPQLQQKPAKLQIFREVECKVLPKPGKKEKLQVFTDSEDISKSSPSGNTDSKLNTTPSASSMDENGGTKIMLDENGNVMKSGRGPRSRKMKTMEMNETQISMYHLNFKRVV